METRQISASECSSSIDFVTMLNALARPEAFQDAASGDQLQQASPGHDELITVIQTHASAVLLAGERAYKLKKPKNLGFLNYSTPALRRHFCGQEVRLNRRRASQVYLGVAPVLLFTGSRLRFGPTFSPEEVPPPGAALNGGYVVDYAVVMVRLPDEAMLESRVMVTCGCNTSTSSMIRAGWQSLMLLNSTNAFAAAMWPVRLPFSPWSWKLPVERTCHACSLMTMLQRLATRRL